MSIPDVRIPFHALDGGLFQDPNPLQTPPNYAVSMDNMDLSRRNELRSGRGYATYSTLAGGTNYPCIGLYDARFVDGQQTILAAFGSRTAGVLRKIDFDGAMDALATQFGGTDPGVIGPDHISFANTVDAAGNEIIVACNGNLAPSKINTAWEVGTLELNGLPAGETFRFVCEYQGYLFGAGNKYRNRWYVSRWRDAEHWDNATTAITQMDFVEGELTAFARYADKLWIFTNKRIYCISGYEIDDFGRQDIMDHHIGCISNSSIISADRKLFWRGDDGFYAMAYDLNPQNISTERMRDTEAARCKALDPKTCVLGDEDNGEVTWFIGGDGGASYLDKRVTFNYRFNSWNEGSGWNAGYAAGIRSNGSRELFLFIGNGSGNDLLYQVSGDNLGGAAMNKFYQTVPINLVHVDPRLAYRRKRWKYIEVLVETAGTYNLKVEWEVGDQCFKLEDPPCDDPADDTFYGTENVALTPVGYVWDGTTWDGAIWNDAHVKRVRIKVDLTGIFIKVRFSNSTADQPFKIYGFTLGCQIVDRDFQGGYGDQT